MIRIEVTSEADVTRMAAAFVTLPVLQDCDYEIWLAGPALASQPWGAGCVRRAWREDGQRGATSPSTFITVGAGGLGGFESQGGAGGSGHADVLTEWHNHRAAEPCPDDCPSKEVT